MSGTETEARETRLDGEYELDAPPQKVWRAISIPALRERWLPDAVPADAEALPGTPGQEVSYRLRDPAPPFLESTVTFRIAPNAAGGTSLRIIHELTDARLSRPARPAANSNGRAVMRAA